MSGKHQIAIIGGAHFDLMGQIRGQAIAGASNPGTLKRKAGGAGLNTATVCVQLGLDVCLIGPVGDDGQGLQLRKVLAQRGIIDGLTAMPGRETGSYVSIIGPDGDLVIALNDLALNEEMSSDWLLENYEKELGEADQWLITANLNRTALAEMVQAAPVPVAAMSVSGAKAIRLRGVLDKIEVLFTNKSEAQSLLGNDEAEPAALREMLQQKGLRSGVITDGGNAVYWWNGDDSGEVLPPDVGQIIDVTGAGDAMAGTVLAGLARGLEFVTCVKAGVVAGQQTLAISEPVVKNLKWTALGV